MEDKLKQLKEQSKMYKEKMEEAQIQVNELVRENEELYDDNISVAWDNKEKYEHLGRIAKLHHKIDCALVLFGSSMIAILAMPQLILPYSIIGMILSFIYGTKSRKELDQEIKEYTEKYDIFPEFISGRECKEYIHLYQKLYDQCHTGYQENCEEMLKLKRNIEDWNYKRNINLFEIRKNSEENITSEKIALFPEVIEQSYGTSYAIEESSKQKQKHI